MSWFRKNKVDIPKKTVNGNTRRKVNVCIDEKGTRKIGILYLNTKDVRVRTCLGTYKRYSLSKLKSYGVVNYFEYLP